VLTGCDLNERWNNDAIDGRVLILSFEPREYNLSSSMTLNATTQASEVRLLGTGVGLTTLRAVGGVPLLVVGPGAPRVSLRGLTLHGRVVTDASELRLLDCVAHGISDSAATMDGGAIALRGGRLEAVRTSFIGSQTGGDGGAVHVLDGAAVFAECLFEGNTAGGNGGALCVAGGVVTLRNKTIFERNLAANSGNSIYVLGGRVVYTLPCPLGRYINAPHLTDSVTLVGAIDKSYPLPCAPGLFGGTYKRAEQSGPGCSGECPEGRFCPLGTVSPYLCERGRYCKGSDVTGRLGATAALPCEEGTYSNATGASSAADCRRCPEGHACTTGSTAPLRCSPGTYAPGSGGLAACLLCPAGKYQDESGALACKDCGGGSYCPVASSAQLPCPSGSYSNRSGLTAPIECTRCEPGFACSTGVLRPTACNPGSHAPLLEMSQCLMCPAGKYQDKPQAIECKPCDTGDFCPEGATLKLAPTCLPGTYANISDTDGDPECFDCPRGHYCGGGGRAPSTCTPGTYAPVIRMDACLACEPGKRQPLPNATVCLACEPGSYCVEGASAPLPCQKGTFSDRSDLSSPEECNDCPLGHFCPLGSKSATRCSAGFFASSKRMGQCDACPSGSFQNDTGAFVCRTCRLGSFCPVGSTLELPANCQPGTYGNVTDADGVPDCFPCPLGHSCKCSLPAFSLP
jgi:predicted outer membrane repeat protein